jgi:molecular chaperone Hsp33
MLRGLGRAEVDGVLAEQGQVEIACDFCGTKYHYDPVDVGELFTQAHNQPPVSGGVH